MHTVLEISIYQQNFLFTIEIIVQYNTICHQMDVHIVYIQCRKIYRKIHPLVSYSMHIQNQTDRRTDRHTCTPNTSFVGIISEKKINPICLHIQPYFPFSTSGKDCGHSFIKIIHILPLHNYIFIIFDSLFGRDKQCSLVSICTELRY